MKRSLCSRARWKHPLFFPRLSAWKKYLSSWIRFYLDSHGDLDALFIGARVLAEVLVHSRSLAGNEIPLCYDSSQGPQVIRLLGRYGDEVVPRVEPVNDQLREVYSSPRS